jgi:hypothetical protein
MCFAVFVHSKKGKGKKEKQFLNDCRGRQGSKREVG